MWKTKGTKTSGIFLHASICLFFNINSNTQIATKKSILLPKSKRDRGGAWLHPSEVVSPKFLVIFSWTPPASLGVRRVPLDEIVMGAAPGWKDLILRARPYATWIKIDHQSLHLDTNNKKEYFLSAMLGYVLMFLTWWCAIVFPIVVIFQSCKMEQVQYLSHFHLLQYLRQLYVQACVMSRARPSLWTNWTIEQAHKILYTGGVREMAFCGCRYTLQVMWVIQGDPKSFILILFGVTLVHEKADI